MRQVVLHAAHHLVQLLHGAAFWHSGPHIKLRPGRLAVEIGARHRLIKQAETRPQYLIYGAFVVGVGPPAHDLVQHRLIVLRLPPFLPELRRQQASGDAEQHDQRHPVHPAVPYAPADIAPVGGAAARQAPQTLRTGHPHRHGKVIQQRRHEQVGHGQRHAEVDHDHPGKVRQVGLLLLRHQQDHQQRSHRGQHGAEQRREHFPVPAAGIMVDHHDTVVDDDTQRHRHPREGIDVDLQPQEEIQRHRDQQVHRQRNGDDQHIAPRTRHDKHEDQQDQQAERRPEIDLVQLIGDIFGVVVAHRDTDLLRETDLQLRHSVLHRLHHPEQVGIGAHYHRQRQHVQPVDAIIRIRQRLLVAPRGDLLQMHHPLPHPLHGNRPKISSLVPQPDPPGLPARLRHPHDLLRVVVRQRRTDILRRNAQGLAARRVEGNHPLERRLPVEVHAAHPFDRGQRIEQLPLHEHRNLLRRQGAPDAVADGGLRLLAAGIERNRRICTARRKFRIDVADLRGYLEAHGLQVRAPSHRHRDGATAVARDAAHARTGADRREHAFQRCRHFRFHDARRSAWVLVAHGDVPRGGRGIVLHLQAREAGNAHHGRHRHQQQDREGRYAPALRHQQRRFR